MITVIGIAVTILGAIALFMSVWLVVNEIAFLRFVAVLAMVAAAISIGVGYKLSVDGIASGQTQCEENQ